MDEIIYRLLLKTGLGLALLGTLRYRLSSLQPANPAGTDVAALLSQVQQQNTFDLTVYGIEGSVSIPLLTGLRPVPISGILLNAFLGPPITTLASSTDPTRNLFVQFNPLDNNHIGGGLAWRPGEPGELIFALLGTQIQPPV